MSTIETEPLYATPYAPPCTEVYEDKRNRYANEETSFARRKALEVASLFRFYGSVVAIVMAMLAWSLADEIPRGSQAKFYKECGLILAGFVLSVWYFVTAERLQRFQTSVKIEAIILSLLMLVPCFMMFPFTALAIYRVVVFLQKPKLTSP